MSHEDLFPRCSVCGGLVNMKDSKTDEHSLAVHENLLRLDCRVKEVAKKNRSHIDVGRERLELLSGLKR